MISLGHETAMNYYDILQRKSFRIKKGNWTLKKVFESCKKYHVILY